jgi:UDP-glucose 4-epimerase
MTWLVTGGAGYIGSHLVAELQTHGERIVVLDDLSRGKRERLPEDTLFVKGDINDSIVLDKVFSENKISGVIHLAAKKSVSESFTNANEYHKVNVEGTKNVIEFCKKYGVTKLIFSSTAAVYGSEMPEGGLLEVSPTNPVSPYGQGKLEAEFQVKNFGYEPTNSYVIFRFFNVIGSVSPFLAEIDGLNIWPAIQKSLQTASTFTIFGSRYPTRDGTCIRDYIHVQDIVKAHVLAINLMSINSFTQETINLGSGRGYTVLEVLRAFEENLGEKLHYEFGDPREGDLPEVYCNANLARSILSWKANRDPFAVTQSL